MAAGDPKSTVIGNADDTLDGNGNGSAIAFLRNILLNTGGGNPATFKSVNMTTATTLAAIKTGAGFVSSLTINTAGVGSQVILYDSLTGSGTKLGTYSTAAQLTLLLNTPFTTGLSAVTSGGTPADITIVYK